MKNYLATVFNKISKAYYRLKLHNDNFSIITNTCIGGVMYHKLGKQFLSPTINLWMHDEDFLKLVHNMDYYFSLQLRFVQTDEGYPVADCDDVRIFFNHYKSPEEAEAKWKERIPRINKDNMFIICSDRPTPQSDKIITHNDMLSLMNIPCRGKVIFSVRKYDDIDCIVPLPKDPNGDYVNMYMYDKNKYDRWCWESAWDWVHWLNTGEVVLRK